MITAGLTFVCDSSLHFGVLNVAAQASSQASGSTTVMNNVTISADPISLGGTLRANGQATTTSGPLANASVALHMGENTLARTQTDSNGGYAFTVPVGLYYFPAALNGAMVYTVVEPSNSSFISTPSAVTSVPVNLAPLYAITAVITLAVLGGLYLYTRGFRQGVPAVGPVTRRPRRAAAPPSPTGETAKDSLQGLKSAPASEAAMPAATKTTEEPGPQQIVTDARYCHNCRAQNQPYAAFCFSCGRSFVAPRAPVRALSGEYAADALTAAAEETAKGAPPKKPPHAAQITEETSRRVVEPESETSKPSEKQIIPAEKRGVEASLPGRAAPNQEQPTTLAHETPQRSIKEVAVGESAMKAEHLTKKFGDVTIVDDLNLEIKHGEVFGFLGPNGAGKTTSIKMMTGLLQPTSGRVLFNGAELVSMQRREIGVCPQELVLWEALTCRENLTFMGKMYGVEPRALENRVNELLDYLSLTDKADQAASKLSGGMKRRLNVALSVVHHPEIVFLDEPSAGLDPQTRQLLWDFIRALRDKEGKTVILTTHVMEEADALSDRVAIIDHGKLLLLDTPDALKKTMGRGDVVEMQLEDIAMNNAIVQRLSTLDGIEEAYELKERVAVRALNAASKLPELVDLIEGAGGSVCDVTIRGNTLEDVFIYLTGRALRE